MAVRLARLVTAG